MDPEQHGFDPDYLVTLDELYHSHWVARKKRRISFLHQAVTDFWPQGHPSRLIHITGTNGKGSVAIYLEQGLGFAGNTGSWTGPHVFDYAERFHLNGERVSHKEIVAVYREKLVPYQMGFVERHGGESLSFAELGILLALHLFEIHHVAWGILEVGAGGRYTPLMALPMAACVLTNVGEDHPRTLGDKLWQRALEKAGIARAGVPFFTSATGEALAYVKATALSEGAPVHVAGAEDARVLGTFFEQVQPSFKLLNLALAHRVIRHFYAGRKPSSWLGIAHKSLPARFSFVAPNVIVDVAHNVDKVGRLAEQLRLRFPDKKLRFLLGLSRRRDPCSVFAALLPLAQRVVVTGASYAGQDPSAIAAALRPCFAAVTSVRDPECAYRRELELLGEDDILILTGSAYMIDQALNPNTYIKYTNASFGRRGRPDL